MRSPKPTRRLSRVLATIAALTIALVPIAAAPARAADPPVLKLAIVADFNTLNPFTTYLAAPININRMQFLGLVEYDKNNAVGPGIAETWQASPDAKTWTFTIPENRVWSDGQPITAEDVAWTYNQIMTVPDLQAANGSLVENFDTVTATDAHTLTITMKEPQAANPGTDIPIVPKHVWEGKDAATFLNDITEPVVGSGPFFVKNYVKGQIVELAPNDKFWGGAPKIGGLTWVYYKNTDAAVQGLKAGEIDLVTGLTIAQFNSLKDTAGITTSNSLGRRYQGIDINPGAKTKDGTPFGDGNPVLHDKVVRQAIMMAIDKQTLIDKVLGGLAKPGVTQVPAMYESFHGLPAGSKPLSFDIDGANKLLDDAGYAKGADGVRVDKTGKPMKLRLMGRSSTSDHAQMAEYIKPWLKQIGIDLDVQMVANTQVSNDSSAGKYDLYFTGWGIGPDPGYQLSINTCSSLPEGTDGKNNSNENNWCDPAFDTLYAAQQSELDPAARADLVKQAFGVIHDAYVLDVLYYADNLEAWRSDRFTDFQRQPDGNGPITGQNSYWGLYSATPVGTDAAAPASNPSGGGLGPGTIAAIAAGAVVLIGGGWFLANRKKSSADHRE